MAAACARAVKQLAQITPLGFGNLRFAATANCPPNIPFLPAAYHAGGSPCFSIAVQAADVVLEALRGAGGMSDIEDRLVRALEVATEPVERIADTLVVEFGYAFGGIDLSPAPFPSDDVSIGGAVESAGVDRFGAPGTLYVAAMITRAIRRTKVRRCGFSGLMLPVLEDSVLARRAAEHPPSLHELLLYSAVCGTGLDTIPLPGRRLRSRARGCLSRRRGALGRAEPEAADGSAAAGAGRQGRGHDGLYVRLLLQHANPTQRRRRRRRHRRARPVKLLTTLLIAVPGRARGVLGAQAHRVRAEDGRGCLHRAVVRATDRFSRQLRRSLGGHPLAGADHAGRLGDPVVDQHRLCGASGQEKPGAS